MNSIGPRPLTETSAYFLRGVAAHPQPAAVGQARLAGRGQLVPDPRQRGPGAGRAGDDGGELDARLQQLRRAGQEIRGLRIGEGDAAFAVDHHDAFARALERVGETGLRGAALGDLALHHRSDVLPHDAHGGEQRAQLVGAGARHIAVQVAAGDATRHRRGGRHRADDAPGQQPRHQAREQHGEPGTEEIELGVLCDRRTRALPIGEGVPGRVVDQQIDLLIDDRGVAVELVPGGIRRAAFEHACAALGPGRDRLLHAGSGFSRTDRLRPVGGDRQIVGQGALERFRLLVELLSPMQIGGDPAPGKRGLHHGEIGRRRACVVDRHQRLVERPGDQHAGPRDAARRIAAQRRGDQAHDQECDEDPPANGPQPGGHPRRGAIPPSGRALRRSRRS